MPCLYSTFYFLNKTGDHKETAMHNPPLLSVIVPVYNVEKYIRNCLDSILAQDFTDYEIILVDDGSTDNSGAICDEYAAGHPAFHCIHKTNGGLPSARKCGFEASQGKYITFVDSDDWISPHMYRKICQAIQDTQADIIFCNYIAAMADREEVCTMPFAPGFYDKMRLEEEIYPFMLYSGTFYKYGISPNLWNKAFRRESFRKHLMHVPNDVAVGEDALASYSCILDAGSAYILEDALYYYRSNADSMSRRTIPVERLLENRKMFQTFRNVIDTETYPCMEKQLDYYFVYQSLLTYELVFKKIAHSLSFKKIFLEECNVPLLRKAFHSVAIRDIGGIHNKLYAFCIKYRLSTLFRFLLRH